MHQISKMESDVGGPLEFPPNAVFKGLTFVYW